MGGGSKAPKPDKNIGKAALASARTGQEMLDWAKAQSEITNQWASEDRARYKDVFRPLENRLISEAAAYDSPERRAAAANQATADVRSSMSQEMAANARRNAAMGIRPDSGRAQETQNRASMATGLAAAGAANSARDRVEAEGYSRLAGAVNLGGGLAVNPGTSMSLSNQSGQSGFSGAMRGYQQQGSLLNQDYQNRMQSWQAEQQSMNGLLGGVGQVVGAGISAGWFSSEDAKTDKTPARGSLGALRKMRVDDWTYKPGAGDGKRHRGPYAEEFQQATGLGDGKTISTIDAVGVGLGAIRELDKKVDKIAQQVGGK